MPGDEQKSINRAENHARSDITVADCRRTKEMEQ